MCVYYARQLCIWIVMDHIFTHIFTLHIQYCKERCGEAFVLFDCHGQPQHAGGMELPLLP